ncbi:TIR domain-containing protein [Chloroflexi bacterium CFX6]|nr:TIR domain-containing protein [Chloroflexi bacterium CFX6]
MSAKIFVSYSRKDSKPARKLINAFAEMGYDVWVDWEDIPPATDWLEQVFRGIEGSDAFIFLASPDSVKSNVCKAEVERAELNNKRIIPIVLREVPPADTHPVIRKLNWIFMRRGDDFQTALAKFRDALELDFEWVADHNRIQADALKWHRGKDPSLLLRGSELRRVRKAVEAAKGREPKPTSLQEMFLRYSVQREKQRNVLLAATIVIIAALAGLTFFANYQRSLAAENAELATRNAILANQQKDIAEANANLALRNEREARQAQQEAEDQRTIAEERARFALAQQSAARAQIYQSQPGELYTSTLLAVASWATAPSGEAEEILRRNISLLPVPVKQTRREGGINSLNFDAQGNLFVTAGTDGNACVWKVSDGEMLFCATSPGSVNDAAFSPDGKLIVTGDESGLVQFIRVEDGETLYTYGAGGIVRDVDIRRSGDQVAVTRDDGRITLLDAQTGKRKYDLQAFDRLKIASFSPNGRYIASGSVAGTVTLWNLVDGTIVSSGRHKGEVLSLAFSPDNRYLITGGADGYAVAARTSDGQEVYRLLHEDWVTDIAFAPDSSWFATVSNDRRIRLWDTPNGKERLRMSQDGYVNEVKVSANGQWLATTGADRTVRVWNASTGAEMFQIPLEGEGVALGFSGDGGNLVTGDKTGGISVWDISVMPAPESYVQFDGLAGDVQFSPSGDWIAASDSNRVWLLRPGQFSTLTARPPGEPALTLNGEVQNVVFSLDSVWLAVSTANGQVLVYNLQTKQPKTLFQTGLGVQIAFTPDSAYLIACSANGSVEMWSLASFRKTADLAGEGSGITSVAASPSHLALGAMDRIAILAPDGEEVTEIQSPGDHALLAFDADGSLLASANSAGLIEVWKFENAGFSRVGSIRKDSVYSLAFNPNGLTLAAGARNDVFLINPFTVREVARIPHAGNVSGVSYSADGNVMATASLRAVQFWDVPRIEDIDPHELVNAACARLTANFSQAQWSNFFGNEEYRTLCEGLPVP